MRGADTFTESLFTMRKLEDFVPARHPLREIRAPPAARDPRDGQRGAGEAGADVHRDVRGRGQGRPAEHCA